MHGRRYTGQAVQLHLGTATGRSASLAARDARGYARSLDLTYLRFMYLLLGYSWPLAVARLCRNQACGSGAVSRPLRWMCCCSFPFTWWVPLRLLQRDGPIRCAPAAEVFWDCSDGQCPWGFHLLSYAGRKCDDIRCGLLVPAPTWPFRVFVGRPVASFLGNEATRAMRRVTVAPNSPSWGQGQENIALSVD